MLAVLPIPLGVRVWIIIMNWGYVPYDVKINENAARTLEYAYADFALAEMAKRMGKKEIAKRFYKQPYNYKKLFDPETGWMRGKNKDGKFQSPFNPLKWRCCIKNIRIRCENKILYCKQYK